MTDLRKQFKATKISNLKKRVEQEEALQRKLSGTRKKDNYLKIEHGTNKFRLAPSRGDGMFYIMRVQRWVTNDTDDGGDKPTYRRTVLDAVTHLGAEKDPIQAYIDKARSFVPDNFDSEESTEILKAITHWQTGLIHQTEWLCYAWKKTPEGMEFGLLPFKKSVRDGLNEEAMMEDPDDPIEIDPYTDPDEGKAVIIKYNKDAKKASDYYKVKVSSEMPLTDEQLEQLSEATPLEDIIKYTNSHYAAAVEGITKFDEEYGIGIIEDEEFIEELEEIKENILSLIDDVEDEDDDKDEVEEDETSDDTEEDEVEEDDDDEDEEDDGDEFDEMNRTELKKVILELRKNHPEDIKSLKVKKSMTDDDIRELIRGFEPTEPEEEEEPEDDETSDDIEALKKKLMKYKTK